MVSCFKGKFKLTSPRGYRVLCGQKEYHKGIDLVALSDKNVYAIADGCVDATLYEANGFGYYVRQLLPDGRRVYYAHLAQGSISVKPGDHIRFGDKLGVMGASGKVTGAHTHLEIRPKGTSSESLDIAAYTGIPNREGTYEVINMFSDIGNSQFKNEIEELKKLGIVNGTGNNKFEPDKPITRGEVAALLFRVIKYLVR